MRHRRITLLGSLNTKWRYAPNRSTSMQAVTASSRPRGIVARSEIPYRLPTSGAKAAAPNGDWLILLHGQGDNRAGMSGFAQFLLPAGYSVVMMDSRAQGESGGDEATYGWKERYDTSAIFDALKPSEKVNRVFALGVSMGAAIALESAAVEPRIKAVVAEDPLANLREVSYDWEGWSTGRGWARLSSVPPL